MDDASRRASDDEVFCYDEALELMGGDEELLVEMVAVLMEQIPEGLAGVRQAVADGDAAAVNAHAHKFKGSVSSLGGKIVTRLSQSLETMGGQGDLSSAPEVCAQLETEVVRLEQAYTEFLAKVGA